MHDLLQFIANNLPLCLAFVVLFFLLLITEMRAASGGATQLVPQAVVLQMNRNNALPVDLRNDVAFREGHLSQAVRLDLKQPSDTWKTVLKNPEQSLILYCETGQNCSKAAAQLKKLGYTDVSLLSGGLKAWREANLPLTKGA